MYLLTDELEPQALKHGQKTIGKMLEQRARWSTFIPGTNCGPNAAVMKTQSSANWFSASVTG